MAKKKRKRLKTKKIEIGSWFGIPISNGRVILGQVLDDQDRMGGFLPCALFDMEYSDELMGPAQSPIRDDTIASMSLGRIAFDRDEWPVGSIADIVLSEKDWPNAENRDRKSVV